MAMPHHTKLIVSAVFALAMTATAAVHAQPGPGGRGPGRDGPGMMGPGMMDRGMYGRMCSPRAAGFAEWRIDRLDEALKLTDTQRPKFDDYRAAAKKAADTMRGACPADVPTTTTGRMEAMEKRMDVMLQAIKTVRPALDALYATLSDEQKKVLDSGSGRHRHRYWRWRDRW